MGEASRPPAPGALSPSAHVARARRGRRGAGAPVRNSNRDVELVANAEHQVANPRPDLIGKLLATPYAILPPMDATESHTPRGGPGMALTRMKISPGSPWEATFGYSRAVRAGDQVFVGATVGKSLMAPRPQACMRMYQPRQEILDETYVFPSIARING